MNRTLFRAHQVVAYLLGGAATASALVGWPAWVTMLLVTMVVANVVMPFQYVAWRAARRDDDHG